MKMLLLLILSISSLVHSHLHPRLSNASDQRSLLEFKALITNPSLAHWNPIRPFCNWKGVSCSLRRDRVVSLNLSGMALDASISPLLSNLSFLQSLDLSNNTLHGHIPQEFGRLSRLKELILTYNTLTGCIPTELGFLAHLKILYLGGNNLTGHIPSSLGNLSALRELSLRKNHLQGNLSALTHLDLSRNHLQGSIPSELGERLTKLQFLSLWENQVSGNIPTSLSNSSKLTLLYLNDKQLSGVVRIELGKLHLLEKLHLQRNQLISGSTADLPFLITALTNCSRLQKIRLHHNRLTGVLPSAIGQLSPILSILSLASNIIGGKIPHEIGNLSSLTFLNLSSNLFTGSIPSSLKELEKLERLFLDDNRLHGSIPSEIGELKQLGLFSAGSNLLSGRIPDSLAHLPQLRNLYLHHNQFSGNIPVSLGECLNLEVLDLSHNQFTGSIPPNVAGLPNLNIYLNLSWNSLQGRLPPEISKLTMVLNIDISGNHLSSRIPDTLGSCIALEYLNLSHNAFHGSIPDSVGKLQNLQDMDLSSNFLSGEVPQSLKKLKMLPYVDFSFNNLTGEISMKSIFANQSIIALFIGNRGLCGPTTYGLPACAKHSNHSLLKRVVVSVSVTAFIGCGLIVIVILWRYHSQRRRLHKSSSLSRKLEHPRITYEELVSATNGVDSVNLLGVGSFGSVYKGILRDGTTVAVKVLDLQNEEAHKSFKRECKVLARVRHRNLVRIITCCSNLEFKALILQFIPNQSLEKHLYPTDGQQSNGGDVCELRLSERLKIAIDIANGISYLHHDCFLQIVHCDIKPSNLLLDDDKTAYVTDFGIARLTCKDWVDSFTCTIALKGSTGYVAPEYGFGGKVSTKGDVYSFGIVLLEMMTRKRPTDDMFVEGLNLRKWVRLAFPERIMEVIDRSLVSDDENGNGRNKEETSNCIIQLTNVGLMCTNESPEERPSMKEVVGFLEYIRDRTFDGSGGASRLRLRATVSSLLASTSTSNQNAGEHSESSSFFTY
eukprot:Gb_24893 [translate_table: standard]